ncbi:hypothetical protein J5Y03_12285 [Bacillus sp. RG28]|uniref:Uncharacterized protein n=1 Tax=Gottfriedia endophytica TaxID=2820819 RepID=A0A940NK66_9BACI|nr:hypothetical protein [Gottfriedia endophytica]MBP0725950.1 hypothetical protein [Gottfriedia endophytica]
MGYKNRGSDPTCLLWILRIISIFCLFGGFYIPFVLFLVTDSIRMYAWWKKDQEYIARMKKWKYEEELKFQMMLDTLTTKSLVTEKIEAFKKNIARLEKEIIDNKDMYERFKIFDDKKKIESNEKILKEYENKLKQVEKKLLEMED